MIYAKEKETRYLSDQMRTETYKLRMILINYIIKPIIYKLYDITIVFYLKNSASASCTDSVLQRINTTA